MHSYTPAGQLETGYEPLHGQLITRRTQYRYQNLNGRSVLMEIDGPLPNGPKNSPEDSDITRLVWDAKGNFITSMTQAGGEVQSVTYDPNTGLLSEIRNAQGYYTQLAFNARLQLLSTRSGGPGWKRTMVQSYRYDAMGNATELTTGDQENDSASSRITIKFGFDAANRPEWYASQMGVLTQLHYDTESRLLSSGRYSNSMARVESYQYDNGVDSTERLLSVKDNQGADYQLDYTKGGALSRITDALGRTTAVSIPQTSHPQPERVSPSRQLIDDFGRVVATVSADSGTTVRTFDAANHLIASTDANGNQANYDYDLKGRILRQRITDSRSKQSTETLWTYQGAHLIALQHPTQSEAYQYDERGLRIARIVTLNTPAGKRTSITRYRFDDSGLLQSTSLPDGSELIVERNGQRQVTAVKRERIATAWLRWLAPTQLIVKDLQRDLIGLKHYLTGNGIEANIQRSHEGVLARLVYRQTRTRSDASRAENAKDDLALSDSAERSIAVLLGIRTAQAAPAASAAGKALPGALGLPRDPQAVLDQRYLWDTQGNLLHSENQLPTPTQKNYAYDWRDRLIALVSASGERQHASRYYYDTGSRRVLSQEQIDDQSDTLSHTQQTAYQPDTHRWIKSGELQAQYDANGQPQTIGQREYVWDALGRLIAVRQADKSIASYTYNHRGERIGKQTGGTTSAYLYEDRQLLGELNAQGRLTRQYIELGGQPFAVIDTPDGQELATTPATGLSRIAHDLRTLADIWFGDREQLVWLHNNHLGATEAATNAKGELIWRADYAAFGQATIRSRGFTLNLRLPGQYEDSETGLYYNRQRYYSPSLGQYISPDPAGNPDGPNGYSYVRNNPLKYIDPDGLILFAFDGTGNSDPAQSGASLSNVVKFRDLYDVSMEKFYITGPGTKDPQTGIENPIYKGGNPADVVESFTGKERIAAMIKYLNDYSDSVDHATAFDIDIVGFSRGAAEARDFANQIVAHFENGYYGYRNQKGEWQCQKVNFRFMGLFDTVLSEHTGSYQLQIADTFKYVAQAVALNEYRGNLVSFPLESIMGAPAGAGNTRIERGFLGSHSDIGGSFAQDDLSKVALSWMVDQAKAAGVTMANPENIIIANPVLHDKSTNLLFGANEGGPTTTSEDREVRYMDGTTAKQRQATSFGMSWADTQKYIEYKSNPNTRDSISGTVDMKGYLEWLNEHGYQINMTIQ